MKILKLTALSLILLVASLTAREINAVTESTQSGGMPQPFASNIISTTASGGVWSSPSTWIGGIVPTASDDVIILGGATVIIDTAASANSVMVGGAGSRTWNKSSAAEGGAPATLRFGETAGFSLTVGHDVTIGAGDTFSTGGGNANAHVLTVGGNLTNDGTLDFATNNNQAGAMIVFTGPSSNTFGGAGPVTDIMWMTVDKGNSSNNILELAVANFTVQGSTTDGPTSNFLFLNHGTFKISGTFTGTHRTFFATPYEIAVGAGLWLNNPNYTIVAQHQDIVPVYGLLRVTAGTYNVGTLLNDSLIYYPGSTVFVEGGNINVAGGFKLETDGSIRTKYEQSGGIVTTCIVGTTNSSSACFYLGSYPIFVDILLTGGEIVIQNPAISGNSYLGSGITGITSGNTTIRIGNAATNGPGIFRVNGDVPNLLIDTSAGGHTVMFVQRARNVEIGPDGKLLMGSYFQVFGGTFINNGALVSQIGGSLLWFSGQNTVYRGRPSSNDLITKIDTSGSTLTIEGGDLNVTELNIRSCLIVTGPNKVRVYGSAGRTTGYIDGTLVIQIPVTGTYNFPVGKNGYSPVMVNVSALGTAPSYLSVTTVDTALPGLLPWNSASRYWQLEETGDLTAGLVFAYTDADVNGNEAGYALWRSTGGAPGMIAGSTPSPASNTVTTPAGIVDFTGNWGIGGPDPGPVSISGTVTTAVGQPIRNATLTISGGSLPSPIIVQTGNFGTYGFTNLQAGVTYTIRVDVKRYRFQQATQIVTPTGNVSNVNFVANPQE